MNEDLSNLLSNLPEGIVLYDENTHKIVLANNEFKKLFFEEGGAGIENEAIEQ